MLWKLANSENLGNDIFGYKNKLLISRKFVLWTLLYELKEPSGGSPSPLLDAICEALLCQWPY